MKYIFTLFIASLLFTSCKNEEQEKITSNKKGIETINQAVKTAGSNLHEAANVSFDFRGISYSSVRNCGLYELKREQVENNDTIQDKITNTGFTRTINSEEVKIADSMATKYQNSVNAVHYFVQVPFGLNDASVNKEFLEEVEIDGKKYNKVKVGFNEEGGGTDFEDIYLYYISKDENTIDYLAYSYKTDGGGMRFRKAYNPRTIKGIRFVDYENYAPSNNDVELDELLELHQKNELENISTIETENIKVVLMEKDCD